ncbi:DUF4215 domain-containing protein [Sandaracinus amylolyticus]|uniref:DUF4215 domain-containing protein n=1 Tax=Sandaracinus amylolyticus TaxID=927083 RepID=UPI001F2EDAEA|nr:DUF4215 domain-containing protein [Sandaracinus amylolyticus]UJR86768.1 Hypothetical protein I5071_88690 [Sandaracinus amylolyticus]
MLFRPRQLGLAVVVAGVAGCVLPPAADEIRDPWIDGGPPPNAERCEVLFPWYEGSCADGNKDDGDGCSRGCEIEDGWDCASGVCLPICGDDLVVGDEVCDDGVAGRLDYCADDCRAVTGSCGDGVLHDNEGCEGELHQGVAHDVRWRCGDLCQVEILDRDVTLADRFGCALRADGLARCWGPEAPPIPEDERFVSLHAGSTLVCAVREDGSPACWGDSSPWYEETAQAFVGAWAPTDRLAIIRVARDEGILSSVLFGITTTGRAEAFAADRREWALWDGHFVSFGETRYVEMAPSSGSTGCAFTADYNSVCWSLDRGDTAPIQPPGSIRGYHHGCWLPADGFHPECRNMYGAVSLPRTFFGERIASFAPDGRCALRPDGTVNRLAVEYGASGPVPGRFGAIECDEQGAGCGVTFGGQIACWEGREGRAAVTPDFDPFAD